MGKTSTLGEGLEGENDCQTLMVLEGLKAEYETLLVRNKWRNAQEAITIGYAPVRAAIDDAPVTSVTEFGPVTAEIDDAPVISVTEYGPVTATESTTESENKEQVINVIVDKEQNVIVIDESQSPV